MSRIRLPLNGRCQILGRDDPLASTIRSWTQTRRTRDLAGCGAPLARLRLIWIVSVQVTSVVPAHERTILRFRPVDGTRDFVETLVAVPTVRPMPCMRALIEGRALRLPNFFRSRKPAKFGAERRELPIWVTGRRRHPPWGQGARTWAQSREVTSGRSTPRWASMASRSCLQGTPVSASTVFTVPRASFIMQPATLLS